MRRSDSRRISTIPGEYVAQYSRNLARDMGSVVATRVSDWRIQRNAWCEEGVAYRGRSIEVRDGLADKRQRVSKFATLANKSHRNICSGNSGQFLAPFRRASRKTRLIR